MICADISLQLVEAVSGIEKLIKPVREINQSRNAPQSHGREQNKAKDSESDKPQVAPAVNIDLTKLYEMESYSFLSPKQELSEPKVCLSLQNFSGSPLCQPASNHCIFIRTLTCSFCLTHT